MSLGHDESGVRYVTKEKVENMITQAFTDYEKDIGGPRHMANFSILMQIRGGVKALAWVGGAVVTLAGLYLAYLRTKG